MPYPLNHWVSLDRVVYTLSEIHTPGAADVVTVCLSLSWQRCFVAYHVEYLRLIIAVANPQTPIRIRMVCKEAMEESGNKTPTGTSPETSPHETLNRR